MISSGNGVTMDGAMVGLWGAMAPPNFFFKILLNVWVLIVAILF